ncbi:serine hydrolase domain-containing protein [Streptomyces prasinopilosus]|uniref:D-alanyl-D-alanine carboxypeptidase n=1 Tax=Streptomyces prasinopilosus TaxID=67344 RepID=A0A1G6JK06_9ACTN|nr:serine hydrolase domain-containing protein [Streptomyces prasinopilosus]SDC19054.1 D-alanyl-D-alanine carboxypeptidase [Streptomyces prasinopilosus]
MTARTRARTRARTAVTSALLAALVAGPLAGAAVAVQPGTGSSVAAASAGGVPADGGPDVAALEKALVGIPDGDVSTALVRVGGRGRWTGTAGVRDLRTGAPALEHARFRAGSTTKVVTAALVLQLVAEGRVELDAPVTRYLPGLLPDSFTEPPTVRHLLTYTSGLKPGANLGSTTEEMYPNRFRTLSPRRVVATAVAKGPAFTPGERQKYQNIDYTVLGLLIEKVTDDRYEDQADIRIFRPLGMRHTGFPAGPDPRIHGPHHRAYTDIGGRTTDVTEWNMSDRWAAGNMISTTADLERFLVALFRGRVVPRPLLDQMLDVPDVEGDASYGMAWERFVLDDGTEIWGKTGSRPGYHTVLAATRDLSRTVVYSVNAKSAREDGFPLVARFALPAFNR